MPRRKSERFPIAAAAWLALTALSVVACVADGGPAGATPAVEERVTTAPTATPFPSTDFRPVVLAADGTTLVGSYYPPATAPAPAVLLLHMTGGQKEDWAFLATRLQEAGYAVMALDLRGHGESSGTVDWTTAPDDGERAWVALATQREVDKQRTAIVGAGIGANLALAVAAAEPQVRAVALLSPLPDDQGVPSGEAISTYGERPLLIVVSEEDPHAAESAAALAELAPASPVLTIYQGADHGIQMFVSQPGLTSLLLGWLGVHLRP